MPRVKVRPEAELDALEAATWYEGERAGLGAQFLGELRAAFLRIDEGPLRFPAVVREVRRAILHRFPVGVFFIVDAERAVVLPRHHAPPSASEYVADTRLMISLIASGV